MGPHCFTTQAQQTGEMEMKVEGVEGRQCANVAKLVTELLGWRVTAAVTGLPPKHFDFKTRVIGGSG